MTKREREEKLKEIHEQIKIRSHSTSKDAETSSTGSSGISSITGIDAQLTGLATRLQLFEGRRSKRMFKHKHRNPSSIESIKEEEESQETELGWERKHPRPIPEEED